jgi:hypothetical protein
MSALIIVSPEHHVGVPLVYNLGETSLIITNDYGAPDAFELAAPSLPCEEMAESLEMPHNPTIILDETESYNLYTCLHALFAGAHEQGKTGE